jgi:hypothetical protein
MRSNSEARPAADHALDIRGALEDGEVVGRSYA